MKEISTTLFDGKTPLKKEVRLYFEGADRLRIVGPGTFGIFPGA